MRALAVPTGLTSSAVMTLAGLTSVADWIGSATEHFPLAHPDGNVAPSFDLVDYLELARRRADAALDKLAWTGWTPPEAVVPSVVS